MRSSASTKSYPSLSASAFPTVLFPVPGIPINTIFFIGSASVVKVFLSYVIHGQMYIAKIHKKFDKERSTFHDRADKTAPKNTVEIC